MSDIHDAVITELAYSETVLREENADLRRDLAGSKQIITSLLGIVHLALPASA